MKKRLLSVLLALCMVLTLLPSAAFAVVSDFIVEDGVLTMYNGSGGDVIIPDGVVIIGGSTFGGNGSVTSVTMPSSVTTISSGAFHHCINLTSVTIPSGVTSIGSEAFGSCYNLTNLIIPSTVTSIGDYAFNDCDALTSVTVPSGVANIGVGMFYNCNSLANVIISSGVTKIGNHMFSGCSNLTSVTIPSSVAGIGDYAFWGCNGLASITIPSSVTSIGDYAFGNCIGLTSMTIPSGITNIGNEAFAGCIGLTSVIIPSSVTSIDTDVFRYCDNLRDIYYEGSQSDWAKLNINFAYIDLYNVTIHYNSTGPGGMGGAGEDPTPNDPSKEYYAVYCNSGYEVFDVLLEECMAKTASTTYNPQLAHMLIAMSNSVYSASDMEKTFESFGFEEKNTLRHEDELLNYSIGLKSIGDETLVLVSIRGTGGLGDDIWSWASNVSAVPDLKGQHLGFSTTTDSLYTKLTEFINAHRSGSGKITYVITGFSRGAAVTNLLAASLLSEGISKSDVYAYAFACPDTIISAKDLTTGYECIFNIADVNDLVSWSPQTLWGFSNNWTKYGHSRWFSHDWNDYGNLAIDNIFNIGSAHDQVKYLDYLRQEKSIAEYKMRDEAKTVLDEAADKRSEQFWTNIKNGGRPQIVEIVVACPVNIEIYASGQLVGSITNNLANLNDESKVYISIVGDKKSVYLLADDTYTFNLTATGEGTMSYTVQNVDVATRDVVDEQVFEQVALISEKQFISEVKVKENIATDVKTQEVKLYVLGGDGEPEKEVLPDGKGTEVPLDSLNDIYTVSFDTTVISLKVPSMKTGSDGKLSSLPRPTRSGYTFIGWFTAAIGGEQITTETTFVCDTTVYAHWAYVGGDTTTNPGNPGYYPGSGYWGNYTPPTYAITIQPPANGTIAVSPKSASKGSTVTITAVPDDGYQLGTLTVSDSNGKLIALTDKGNGKYAFIMPNGKVSIDATFLSVETLWSNPFTDITEGAWYYEAVRFAQGNGLMSGYGNGIFAPDANLSRAMMAQILYNKEGRPTVTASTFADVAEGAWYTNAVSWAAAHGIVDGYGNGLFGPNDNITREQLAVMLWRYAGEPVATDKELHFNDADSASGYAVDALCWATDNGIINGKGNDILDPRAQATRAEVAQMLMNYLKK